MRRHTIYRGLEGCIDYDYYRGRATTLRAQMRADLFKRGMRAVARPLAGASAIAAAYALLQALMLSQVSAANGGLATPKESLIFRAHAVGAQIYECKIDRGGKPAWQFREPVATLIVDGKTVGRHYVGPRWELTDGSNIGARVTAQAPGASKGDIPLLALEANSWLGTGQISFITTVQRLNTRGGVAEGACDTAGALLSVPYTADYAFYRKDE